MQNNLRNPKDLKPHPENPRGEIDVESIDFQQFVADIRFRGIIQPIVITPDDYILAGHRRREAAISAELNLIPVVVRELGKDEFVEDFFISENLQRQDLSLLEEAQALVKLQRKIEKKTKRAVSLNDLSRRVNIPIAQIRSRLAILELPERVRKLFHGGELPLTSSTKLLKLRDYPDEIEKFADRLVTRQVAAKNLDVLIARRMEDLDKDKTQQKILERDEKFQRIIKQFPENHYTPVVTRKSVINSLVESENKTIDLFKVKVLFEQTCCNCGMMGNESLCQSCPLPKFVNGVIGRAEEAE